MLQNVPVTIAVHAPLHSRAVHTVLKQAGWLSEAHDSSGSSETVPWLARCTIMPMLICSETAHGLAACPAASSSTLAAVNGVLQFL